MGWNSTKPLNHTRRQHYVSIPNGMEFYAESDGSECPDIVCFNSQWDGILPEHALEDIRELELFQFPMGWNSTTSQKALKTPRVEFQFPMGWNSTELILRKHTLESEFQFPMGWNSTHFPISSGLIVGVSIPNGMEFY